MKKLDLNISENYVENWGIWEAVREIICNAKDADSNYKVEVLDDNNLLVSTKTIPTISQLKIIGNSQSRKDDKKIGQFGEGFKLAALTLTRDENKLEVITPKYTCGFSLEINDYCDDRVLFMNLEEKETESDGCKMFISAPNVSNIIKDKFVDVKKQSLIEKENKQKMKVYFKGVFVSEIDRKSLYDYSLNNFKLNRDRNVINQWDFEWEASSFLSSEMNYELAKKIIDSSPDFFEVQLIKNFPSNFGRSARKLISKAIKDKYGENIVISTDDSEMNELAKSKGVKVVRLNDGFSEICDDIETSKQFMMKEVNFKILGTNIFDDAKSELMEMLEVFNLNIDLYVYENNSATFALMGKADGNKVYLNEILFLKGNKKKRVSVFLHEIAHVMSKADDATIRFEDCLSDMLGELGSKVLELNKLMKLVK